MTSRALLVPTVLVIGIGAGLALVLAGIFFLGNVEYARVVSPDGAFVAVTTFRRYQSFIPRGPGGGSDKPGRLEIVRVADGRSCGSAPLDMVWMSQDLSWSLTATPPSASVSTAFWDLERCTVE